MTSKFFALAVELFDEVVSHLQPKELTSLRLVCRRFNQQAFRHVFTPLRINLFRDDKQKLRAISEDGDSRRCILSLSIKAFKSNSFSGKARNLASDGWVNLKELILHDFLPDEAIDWVMKLVSDAPNLHKLEMNGCLRLYHFLGRLTYMERVPRLRELKLSNSLVSETILSKLLSRLKDSLHKLSFRRVELIGKEDSIWVPTLRKWGGQLSSLKYFSIIKCSDPRGDILFLPDDCQEIPDKKSGMLRLATSNSCASYQRKYGDKALEVVAALMVYIVTYDSGDIRLVPCSSFNN